jgi:hypothetical protein
MKYLKHWDARLAWEFRALSLRLADEFVMQKPNLEACTGTNDPTTKDTAK